MLGYFTEFGSFQLFPIYNPNLEMAKKKEKKIAGWRKYISFALHSDRGSKPKGSSSIPGVFFLPKELTICPPGF